MSIGVVFQQMIIIFILILIGAVLYKKSMFNDISSSQISGIIMNFCNPALLISSVFVSGQKVSNQELITGAIVVTAAYLILILCSYCIPLLLHIPVKERYAYRLLTIFGNVGFIGIPLASAVLGPASLIYVSINNLVYNILMYTLGFSMIHNAKKDNCVSPLNNDTLYNKKENQGTAARLFSSVKSIFNVGTISAVLTIALYVSDMKVPVLFSDTLSYIGRSTTFLSMLVLGVSVAQMSLRDIFRTRKLYVFVLLRQILLPIGCIFLFRLLTDNLLILSTTVLLLAVPAGNMPLIVCRQQGLDNKSISTGIILSTLLSLITIPVVTLFL